MLASRVNKRTAGRLAARGPETSWIQLLCHVCMITGRMTRAHYPLGTVSPGRKMPVIGRLVSVISVPWCGRLLHHLSGVEG
jgi:hypothetical protein